MRCYVFDPFNGSGQTTKIAKKLKRKFVGIDIYRKYTMLARRRLKEPLNLRHESLTLEFEHEYNTPVWKKIPSWDEKSLDNYR